LPKKCQGEPVDIYPGDSLFRYEVIAWTHSHAHRTEGITKVVDNKNMRNQMQVFPEATYDCVHMKGN